MPGGCGGSDENGQLLQMDRLQTQQQVEQYVSCAFFLSAIWRR